MKAGDPLFTIDPRPFEAALEQAQANLARDRAAGRAQPGRHRAPGEALRRKASPRSRSSTRSRTQASVDAGGGARGRGRGAQGRARPRAHAHRRADRAGALGTPARARGRRRQGERHGSSSRSTRSRRSTCASRCPSSSCRTVQAALAAGPVRVYRARRRQRSAAPEAGELVFIDNSVDRTTGTIALKARFENAERRLWPGQYVDVVLQPRRARRRGRRARRRPCRRARTAQLVFVVDDQKKAQVRRVHVDFARGGSTVIARRRRAGRARRDRRPAPPRAGCAGDDRRGAGARRRPSRSRGRERRRAVHPPPGDDDAADERAAALRRRGLPRAAGERPAERRLPDARGDREPARHRARDDGLGRRDAARASSSRRSRASTR